MPAKPFVIALEEHFQFPELAATYGAHDANRAPALVERMADLGEGRIREMDATGIDFQVLSHSAPAVQKITDPAAAVHLARLANDRLAEAVRGHPPRFAGIGTPRMEEVLRAMPAGGSEPMICRPSVNQRASA